MQGPQDQSPAHKDPLSTELGVALEDHHAVTQKPFKHCGMALGPGHGSFQAADFKCSRSLRLGVWCSGAFLVLKSQRANQNFHYSEAAIQGAKVPFWDCRPGQASGQKYSLFLACPCGAEQSLFIGQEKPHAWSQSSTRVLGNGAGLVHP